MWPSGLAQGFRYAATHAGVRASLLLLALTAMAGFSYGTLMPVFATKILHGDSRTLGFLKGAPGLGAVLVGVLPGVGQGSARSLGWVRGACAIYGVLLLAFSQTRTLGWAAAALVPMGMATMILVTETNARIQTSTPDAPRGRVMAIWFMIFSGFVPLGSVLTGWVATSYGPVVPLAGGWDPCAPSAGARSSRAGRRATTFRRSARGSA